MAMYVCEICKGAPAKGGYPRKYRWKTEKGYLGHDCWQDEQLRSQQAKVRYEQQQLAKAQKEQAQLEEWRKLARYQPGDRLWLVYHVVTAPTHVANGWGRMVRVRYEELREYYVQEVTIREVVLYGYKVEERKDSAHQTDLFATREEAETKRTEREHRYAEHLRTSSEYR